MTIKKLVFSLIIELSLLTSMFVVVSRNITNTLETRTNNREYVRSLCDWAYTHRDNNFERRCGGAQTKTNTEYMCITQSVDCWVEAK